MELWGTEEIGEFTGRKRSAVSELVNRPGFPGHCMGTSRCRRWFKDSVIAYLREQERVNRATTGSGTGPRRSFRVSTRG